METIVSIKHLEKSLVVAGLTLIFAGFFAFFSPLGSSMGISYAVGAILLLSAGCKFVLAWKWGAMPGGFHQVAMCLVEFLFGTIFLIFPVGAASAVVLVFCFFLLLAGIFQAQLALAIRPAFGWTWPFIGGLLTLLLALAILLLWPIGSLVFLGVLIGIHFLLSGAALLMMGLSAQ